jgi:hypothetical protein
MLDFVGSTDDLGKPTSVDLQLGLATAPVLYALEEYPELEPIIKRKFEGDGDIALVCFEFFSKFFLIFFLIHFFLVFFLFVCLFVIFLLSFIT